MPTCADSLCHLICHSIPNTRISHQQWTKTFPAFWQLISQILIAHLAQTSHNCLHKTQKETSPVCMYTSFIWQDRMKLALGSHSKCNTAHTEERIQWDPGFNINRISAAMSQSCPSTSFWILPGISQYCNSKRRENFPLLFLSDLNRVTHFYHHHFSNQCTSTVLERALCASTNQFSISFVSFL